MSASSPAWWRDYWVLLAGRRRRAAAIIAAAIVGATAESLGLLTLLPMLGSSGESSPGSRTALVATFGALLLTAVVLRWLVDRSTLALSSNVELALRSRFLQSLTEAPWRESVALRQGDLSSALMSESTQVSNGLTAAIGGLSAGFVAVLLVLTAVALSPALSALAAVFALGTSRVYARSGAQQADIQRHMASALENINEESSGLLANLKYLRSSGSQRQWAQDILGRLTNLREITLANGRVPVATRAVVEVSGAVFLVVVMAWALLLVKDVSRGLVFIAIFYRVIPRLQSAQGQLMIARAQTVWVTRWKDRLHGREPFRPRDDEELTHTVHPTFSMAPRLPLTLRDIDVRYLGRADPAISSVSFTIGPSERVAIVGSTGSGKSTLLDVLTGLLAPDAGDVLLNGQQLHQSQLEEWQQSIAIVPQEPPVRHASISDNVRWLAPDPSCGSVEQSLHQAQFGDVLAELADGTDSIVGTRHGLSGGQRQRLAIARALFREPQLLILDECTSALDPATEERVLDSISALPFRPAVVLVTHRLHTLHRFPRVLVLEHGRLVYDGPPDLLPTTLEMFETSRSDPQRAPSTTLAGPDSTAGFPRDRTDLGGQPTGTPLTEVP